MPAYLPGNRSALLAAALTLCSVPASADTPEMELTPSGVVNPVADASDPFLVSGTTTAKRVRVVFVRTGFPVLGFVRPEEPGGDDGRVGCAEYRAALQADRIDEDELGRIEGQVVTLQDLVHQPKAVVELSKELSPHPVYVTAAWERPAETKGKAKFQVAARSQSFFRPGAAYCALVVEHSEEEVSIAEMSQVLASVVSRGSASEPSDGPDPCDVGPEADPLGDGACSAARHLMNQTWKVAAALTPEREFDAAQAYRVATEAYAAGLLNREVETEATQVRVLAQDLCAALSDCPESDAARAEKLALPGVVLLSGEPVRVPAYPLRDTGPSDRDEGLGGVVAELLVQTGDLVRIESGSTVSYATIDGRGVVSVRLVAPKGGAAHAIEVALESDGKANTPDAVTVLRPPASLVIPRTDLTLLDLLEYENGRLSAPSASALLGAAAFRVHDLGNASTKPGKLIDVALSADGPGGPERRGAREAVGSRLEVVAALLDDARLAKDSPKVEDWTLLAALGRWSLPSPAPLAEALRKFANSVEPWDLRTPRIAVPRRVNSVTVAEAVGPFGGFTQKGVFDHYVTTSIGAFRIRPESRSPAVWIPALQLHLTLAPNPVDEPMWTNRFGEDLKRLVGFDVGVAVPASTLLPNAPTETTFETGGFGPENRWSGPGDGPAWYFGASAQLLPYVTLGGGWALVEGKQTLQAAERARVELLPAFDLTLEANLIGLFRSTLTQGATGGEK